MTYARRADIRHSGPSEAYGSLVASAPRHRGAHVGDHDGARDPARRRPRQSAYTRQQTPAGNDEQDVVTDMSPDRERRYLQSAPTTGGREYQQ